MNSQEICRQLSCLSRRMHRFSGIVLRRKIQVWAFVIATSVAGSAPCARAQASADQNAAGNLKDMSLAQLGNVEVTTVSKEPEKLLQTPAAIYVLTQDDIRRAGATSIPEALRLVPGVEIARIDSDSWSVGIRGFGGAFSRSVLVLIDGRSVYTPLFEGVYWDVQNVMLQDVDRIEVIRGPGGTIWGSNAVNGVINIITKSSKDTLGTLAAVGSGTVDQATGAVRYGGTFHKTIDYRVYGTGFVRGQEFHTNGDPFDEWRMGQLGFRADWSRSDQDSVTFQGDIYSGENGGETNIAFFFPPSQANVDATSFVSGGNLLMHWKHEMNNGSDFRLQAYFDRTNRQDPQLGETRDTFDLDFIYHLALPKHQDFIWGLGARLSPSNFLQTQPTVSFTPNQQTDTVYSGFLQDEIPLITNKLSLTAGMKIEHNNFSGFDLEPGLRALWAPDDHQAFWTSVTRAVRTPSRLDQDLGLTGFVPSASPFPIFLEITGNPTFQPEELLGYEAGYRSQVNPAFYVDVATFFNNYNDLQSLGAVSLGFAQSPPPSYTYILLSVPFVNGLEGNTDGMEVDPDWKPTNWWQLKGSYSYLQMHLKNKPGITDTSTASSDTGSSPHHEVVIQSLFDLPGQVEIDPIYRYVSALPAQHVPRYSTMDLHLGWQFAKRLELSVTGDNLFRPYQVEFGSGVNGAPNIGIKRGVYAQLTWKR